MWALLLLIAQPENFTDAIVAWVDETPITRLHIHLHKMLVGEDLMLEKTPLDNIILSRVIAKYLKEKKMLPEESAIEEEANIYAAQYDLNKPPYVLENGNGPLKEAVRDIVYLQMGIQMVKNYVVVTTDDLKKFYQKEPNFFVVPQKYKLSFASFTSKEEAEQTLSKIKNGESAEITWSPPIEIDPGGLRKEVRSLIEKASVGDIVGPINMNGLYYLIKYVGITPPKKPASFEELMKNDEFAFLRYRAQSKLLRERYLKELKSVLWPYYKQTHIVRLREN